MVGLLWSEGRTKMNVGPRIGTQETSKVRPRHTRQYKVAGFPSTVFVDRDLKIVRKWTGPLNEEKLEELVAQILR